MRLKLLRKERKMTQQMLAQKIGVSRSTVAMWETGSNEPDNDTLVRLALLFNCSTDYLLEKSDVRVDDHLLDIVNELPDDVLQGDGNALDALNNATAVRIPVLGTIPAGIPLEAIEEVLDWEEIPRDWTRGGKEYFALRITGNSMEPDYRDGDVLIIRRQDDCESGDDCAVMVNGDDATFKRVRKSERGVSLTPLNPAYETLFYTNEEANELPVRILGVVVELRRSLRSRRE